MIVRQTAMMEIAQPPPVSVCSLTDDGDGDDEVGIIWESNTDHPYLLQPPTHMPPPKGAFLMPFFSFFVVHLM